MITVITACSRPSNLSNLFKSLNFDYIFEWIIVYDTTCVNIQLPFFNNNRISEYFHSEPNSKWGNSQRNKGLDMVKNINSYIYFLDDDNIIHPMFYKLLDRISLENEKIYTFNQDNHGIITTGNRLFIGGLDTAIYLIHYKYCKNKRYDTNKREADGLFFLACSKDNEDKHIYITETLCYSKALS